MPDPGLPLLAGIALGSNLPSTFGSRAQTLQAAVQRLGSLGAVKAVSSFHDTAPVGYTDQPRFLNAAALLETRLPAPALLTALLAIEAVMGRDRAEVPAKGPRVIDLDLLFLADQIFPNAHSLPASNLILPHPALADRLFVLEPLSEIAPGWIHPLLHCTVLQLLDDLRGTLRLP